MPPKPISPTPPPIDLQTTLETLETFILTHKPHVSHALKRANRSHLSRQIQSLPSPTSPHIQSLALTDLPIASHALALASLSTALQHANNHHFPHALRALDVALIMLGLPTARPLLAAVPVLQRRLPPCESRLPERALLGVESASPLPLAPRLSGACVEYPTVDMTLQSFRAHFLKDEPVVIRDCAAAWPAMERWRRVMFWDRVHGDRTVPVEHTAAGASGMTEGFWSLREVVALMMMAAEERAGESVYLAQHPLFDYIPELMSDISCPEYTSVSGKDGADVTNVWMGCAGSGTKLHYDTADNLLVQVVGRKRVVLISAEQTPFLYRDVEKRNLSRVDVENPDLDKFPLFSKVTGLTVDLAPGDALYMPAECWHWVKAHTSSISVNFWF